MPRKDKSSGALLKESSGKRRNFDFEKIKKMGTSPKKISPFSANINNIKNPKKKSEKVVSKQARHPLQIVHSIFISNNPSHNLINPNLSFFSSKNHKHENSSSSLDKGSHANLLRNMSITKINKMHMLQVLMDIPSTKVKSFFGCVSSYKFKEYLDISEDDLHVEDDFVREASKRILYTDDCLEDLPRKMRNSESFKLTREFSTKDRLAHDEKLKMTTDGIKNFGIDIFLYENFFDKVIEMKAVSKTKHYRKDDDDQGGKSNGREPNGRDKSPNRDFKKQNQPEKDGAFQNADDHGAYEYKRQVMQDLRNLAPQNSLEKKGYERSEYAVKKVIKSFQIKPQKTIDISSDYFADKITILNEEDQKAHKTTKIKVKNCQAQKNDLKEMTKNTNFSNKKKINPDQIEPKNAFDYSINVRNMESSEVGSHNEKTIKCSYISEIKHLHNHQKKLRDSFNKQKDADIYIKFPDAMDLFEKSLLNSSNIDQRASLMRTFYLYSFKDDMTLGNLTNADKDEYEIVKFHSRSLEDLSKFDWSGSGGTQNQSEFGKITNLNGSNQLNSLVMEQLVDIRSLDQFSKASNRRIFQKNEKKSGKPILPQNLNALRKVKNRTFTNFKSHLERFPNCKTMKVLDLPFKKDGPDFQQNSEFAESIISNIGTGLKHIEMMSNCLQKSKDSFNILRKSKEILETSGCRIERKTSNDSSKIRNLLNKMVNPDTRMGSNDSFRHQSKKSIFSNMKKEGLNISNNILIQPTITSQIRSNNCTLKHIASKNVSSIFEQFSKNKNTKLVLESLQVSANSNNLLNDDYKFRQNTHVINEHKDSQKEFEYDINAQIKKTLWESPGRNIHTFRKRSTKKESNHGRIQSNEESKLKTLFMLGENNNQKNDETQQKKETLDLKGKLKKNFESEKNFDLIPKKKERKKWTNFENSFDFKIELDVKYQENKEIKDKKQKNENSNKIFFFNLSNNKQQIKKREGLLEPKKPTPTELSSRRIILPEQMNYSDSDNSGCWSKNRGFSNSSISKSRASLRSFSKSKSSTVSRDSEDSRNIQWSRKIKKNLLVKKQQIKKITPLKKPPRRRLKKLILPKSFNSQNDSSFSKKVSSPKSALAKKLKQTSKIKNSLGQKLSRISKMNSNTTNHTENLNLNSQGSQNPKQALKSIKSSKSKKLNYIRIKDSFDNGKKIQSSTKNSIKNSFKELNNKKGNSMYNNSLGYCKELFQKRNFNSKPQKIKSIYKQKICNSDVNKSKAGNSHFEPSMFQDLKYSKSRQKTRHCSKEENLPSNEQGFFEFNDPRNPLSQNSSINIKNLNINLNLNVNFSNKNAQSVMGQVYHGGMYQALNKGRKRRINFYSNSEKAGLPKMSSFQNIVQDKILKATMEQKDLMGKLNISRKNKNLAFFNKNFKKNSKSKYFKNITLV